MKRHLHPLRLALLAVTALALALCGGCEVLLAWPVAGWLYLLVACIGATALLRPVPPRKQLPGLGVCAAILGIIVALHRVEWTSRKPFLRDLARVRAGMTESEVRHIMARYPEGTGWPAFPYNTSTNADATLTDLGTGRQLSTTTSPAGELVLRDSLVFRHSSEGRFNSDWGIVSLASGHVVRVEFSPD